MWGLWGYSYNPASETKLRGNPVTDGWTLSVWTWQTPGRPPTPREDMENEVCAQSRLPGLAADWKAGRPGGDNTPWLVARLTK